MLHCASSAIGSSNRPDVSVADTNLRQRRRRHLARTHGEAEPAARMMGRYDWGCQERVSRRLVWERSVIGRATSSPVERARRRLVRSVGTRLARAENQPPAMTSRRWAPQHQDRANTRRCRTGPACVKCSTRGTKGPDNIHHLRRELLKRLLESVAGRLDDGQLTARPTPTSRPRASRRGRRKIGCSG